MQSERVLLAGLLTKALARRGEQYVQHDLSKARLFLHILTWLFQAFKWSMWWTNFPMQRSHFVRWHLQCTWDQSVNDTNTLKYPNAILKWNNPTKHMMLETQNVNISQCYPINIRHNSIAIPMSYQSNAFNLENIRFHLY